VEDLGAFGPADRVTLDESVSTAPLVVLERLTPAEQTVFLRSKTCACSGFLYGRQRTRTDSAADREGIPIEATGS
jgi:hypothetical protein